MRPRDSMYACVNSSQTAQKRLPQIYDDFFSHVLGQVEAIKLTIEDCSALVVEVMLGEVGHYWSGILIIEEVSALVPEVLCRHESK